MSGIAAAAELMEIALAVGGEDIAMQVGNLANQAGAGTSEQYAVERMAAYTAENPGIVQGVTALTTAQRIQSQHSSFEQSMNVVGPSLPPVTGGRASVSNDVQFGLPDDIWHRIADPQNPAYHVDHHPEGSTFRSIADPSDSVSGSQVNSDIVSGILINSTPNMPVPGKKTKRSSSVEISTDAKSKRTKVRHTPASAIKTIASQTISTAQVYYDSHLLEVGTSEKRLTRLNLKLGKQLYPDLITPFLANLCGKGVVRMQFAGRCVSDTGKRHNHFQMFRHRLSQGNGANPNTPLVENDWPSDFRKNILSPVASKNFYPRGATDGNFYAAAVSPWSDMRNGQCYWAPYNLADLEDCSWNLNAMKLYPTNFSTPTPGLPTFQTQVATLLPKNHYRSSYLYNNNYQTIVVTAGVPNRPSTYRFKAVLNKGSVCYDFMNKGSGGAKVELIVYRVKKSANLDWTPSSASQNFINLSVSTPIGIGYLETCREKAGTEDLGGRNPKDTDIIDNPQFPLLPHLKKTRQANCPFIEVSRQTFAMPSGSRREMNVEFGGAVYDPVQQISAYSLAVPTEPVGQAPSVFDEYTYGIMISCCGVVCTDEISQPISKVNIVGDMISRCDVQFYATYTEHIGACQYKHEGKPIMYSAGTLLDMPASYTGLEHAAVTMLPQSTAMRTPATSAGAGGNNVSTGAGMNMVNGTPAAYTTP